MLRRAISSVLAQTYEDLEVVISDNASAVDVRSVVDVFHDSRLRYQRHETRLPMTDNWNSCLALARGEYFLLLSDDDVLRTGALASLVDGFLRGGTDRTKRVGFCYGQTQLVDAADRGLWRTFRGAEEESGLAFYRGWLTHRRATYPSGTLFRTQDIRAVGGYDGDRFGAAADIGAAMQVAVARGLVRYVDRVVCNYTEHETNLSHEIDPTQWAETLREIGALVEAQSGLAPEERANLQRLLRNFESYVVMDFVAKRVLASGGGALQAWAAADRARASVVGSPSPRARARMAAKLAYLAVQSALQGPKQQP
jgi:glycosyltransferase involved in cell wall biosynthesis